MHSKFVTEFELRRLVNEGRYFERMLAGEFRSQIIGQNPRKRGDRYVRRTMSQTVEYRDRNGYLIARVHQYVRPDGVIAGSGKPDPKLLIEEDVVYMLDMREDWDVKPR